MEYKVGNSTITYTKSGVIFSVDEIGHSLLPQIINIETFNNKVTQVTFDDNSKVRAVCGNNDVFNLEQGISICIAKKLLGGTKEYNNLINKAIKLYETKEREKIEQKQLQEQIKIKKQKAQLKKQKYLKNKELRKQEQFIKMLEDNGYEIKRKKSKNNA